ncbi:ABC transporter ATP-binding protein [Natronosalvus caseinilyticus]|uniref:ABC transporter ATP-binding protein n=1 Tax=Natronosalvus caseinilyticus TaxID=2953747 RepID=UPI0028A7D3FE|nr:ABC transporter ATP-binding protein [Natronosalvus caseinilyticus]
MSDSGTPNAVVEAVNVTKRFGDQNVLRGLDFTVAPGEIVLLMGPNGAGKSVFVSCLSGSATPDGGTITLFDELTPRAARPAVSTMFQGAMADPDLTGRENLQFYEALHPNGTGRWRELVTRLEIEDDLDRVVGDYSGGMQRKLEIAITLSLDVPFYVLDEPTIELDLATIRELHDLLLGMRTAGKTVLITSHAPLDAQIADRIVFVRDGKVIASDAPRTLIETLPPVLRVRGTLPPENDLLGGRVFRRGDEIRGFLEGSDAFDEIRTNLEMKGADLVDIDRPSYTDLFNYYTYVHANE